MGKTVLCKINCGQFNPDFLIGDKVVNLSPNKFMPKVFRFKILEMYPWMYIRNTIIIIYHKQE